MIPTFTIDVLLYGVVHDNSIILPQAGALLVAQPVLDDPNFTRTVILLLAHNDAEGSMGVVINRPGSTLDSSERPPVVDWIATSSGPHVEFIGGPVEESGYICLSQDFGSPTNVTSLDMMSEDCGSGTIHRVFQGYSGWGPGQLSYELTENAWWVLESEPSDAFDHDPFSLWSRVLARQTTDLRKLADYPVDPTVN
jgi:putative transcriptional regulator